MKYSYATQSSLKGTDALLASMEQSTSQLEIIQLQ